MNYQGIPNTLENQKQFDANKNLVDELRLKLKHVKFSGRDNHITRHQSKGKLLVHDRINYLLDKESPFIELSPLAAIDQYNNDFPSAGIITGIGIINNIAVIIVANDATVKGGTYVKETIKKHLRAQEIAEQNKLPCIYIVDSGGIFLPNQSEVFPDKDDFGRIFYNQARMSAQGIPQISIVMGSCTAGGAYIPAMSDETIIVKNQGTIFLAGPPLVKAATGEIVSDEELGGGDVHTKISGVADHLAENDIDAIQKCRKIIKMLPTKDLILPENNPLNKKDNHNIYHLIPSGKNPFPDVHHIINELSDFESFNEFKANYGETLVTGFANINGNLVGILANNGILFSESALKGTHFIQLCNSRNIPMLFLQNITGFMVGKEYENRGIAKDGAKMVNALANSSVPFITIIIGGSYGAGNYAMGGRAYNPRFLFMWPNSRISVMGAQQAAEVLTTIKKDQKKANGQKVSQKETDTIHEQISQKYETEGSPYYSTSRLWDDGIIDPAQTKDILGLLFPIISNQNNEIKGYGIFRM